MSEVDTSAEACRGGVGLLRAAMTPILHSERLRLARLIEALLAERDALAQSEAELLAACECLETQRDMAVDDEKQHSAALNRAEAERDAAQAEVARLREALEGVLEIEGWSEDHPRYIKARAALAKEAGDAG